MIEAIIIIIVFFINVQVHHPHQLGPPPGVESSISARSHIFVEIDHEIISTVILLPSAESFKKGCSQRKYVHKVLANHLFKLAQEIVWLGELTVPP